MESMPQSSARRAGLPVILIAAVIQGWSLYALHRAIGHKLDPQLSQLLTADWNDFNRFVGAASIAQAAAGVFIDLDGDGTDEFILLIPWGGRVYQNHGGHWEYIGILRSDGRAPPWNALMKALSDGTVTAAPHSWKDLLVGDHRYRVVPAHY